MKCPAFLLLVLASVIAFCSCDRFFSDPYARSWKVTSIDTDDTSTTDASYNTIVYKMNEGYLRLYKTGHYTLFGKFGSVQGSWVINEEQQTLTLNDFAKSGNAQFDVTQKGAGWLHLRPVSIGGEPVNVEAKVLLKDDPHFEHGDVDLLSAEMNKWRLKPAKRATKEELKKRVIDHINFMIAYFQLTEDSKQGYFEVWQLQSPYGFYNNGMAIDNYESSDPQPWRAWFYDETEAAEGHKLMAQALRSVNKYPAGKKTFTEAYLIVLKEMKEFLENK